MSGGGQVDPQMMQMLLQYMGSSAGGGGMAGPGGPPPGVGAMAGGGFPSPIGAMVGGGRPNVPLGVGAMVGGPGMANRPPPGPGTLGYGIQQGIANGTWSNEGGNLRYLGPQGGGQGLLGDMQQSPGHGLLRGMPEMDAKARLRKAMLSGQNSER